VSDTRVSLLTPVGTGAIATIEVAGPRAWEFARKLFRPAGKPLPEIPELHRFWFGTIGEGAGDEVILAATAACGAAIEVHCHGGQRVVRWIIEQFIALGCTEGKPTRCNGWAFDLLPLAPTLRTASILLDQLHGAFDSAIACILESLDPAALAELAKFAPIGKHLIQPWKVVIAGPPNVGKSSLVNALAGYQRSVVSEVAGTTRDVVSVQLAFDGWPVELTDTAGLRDAEGLEAEGIDRAKRVLAEADLVVWVMDASVSPVAHAPGSPGSFAVWNKSDLAREPLPGIAVSALHGTGIAELVAEIIRQLVPHAPPPGAAVPFTPQLTDLVEAADAALAAGRTEEAARLLRSCNVSGLPLHGDSAVG
jgi:tRNA modification GTPase